MLSVQKKLCKQEVTRCHLLDSSGTLVINRAEGHMSRLSIASLACDLILDGEVVIEVRKAATNLNGWLHPTRVDEGDLTWGCANDCRRSYPLVRFQHSSHPMIALRLKRLTDLVVPSTAIAALSPIMLVAAAAI